MFQRSIACSLRQWHDNQIPTMQKLTRGDSMCKPRQRNRNYEEHQERQVRRRASRNTHAVVLALLALVLPHSSQSTYARCATVSQLGFPLTPTSNDATKRTQPRLDNGRVTAYYAAMPITLPLCTRDSCTSTATPQAALSLWLGMIRID